MPLFSEHIANMYYGSSSPYTGLPYGYSASVSPIGSSYSALYLNPGGSYSNHSSLTGYSRAPLSSRWITSSGRNYSPMLSTISERSSASPVRINSPRRLPLSTRTYGTSTYTPRPLNINTADIDVSRDKYRYKHDSTSVSVPVQSKEAVTVESDNGPFMPRVDGLPGKPETGIDSSPGKQRSTIKRGRTVVRLYTIKRKERDSPRKPIEDIHNSNISVNKEGDETMIDSDMKEDQKEFIKWREKLSDDLNYKDKREKKSLGAKLVEKFIVKDNNEKGIEVPTKVENQVGTQSLPTTPLTNINAVSNKALDRRCSMELLAEQANLLDSLIMRENLSTGTLDLTKVGIGDNPTQDLELLESIKIRKQNSLKTTKSDHSLHDSMKSYHKDVRDPKCFNKRRSLKKSSSSSSIRRLDSITEFPKEPIKLELPAIKENKQLIKKESLKKQKPKLKAKITSSVEISPTISPLKFRIDNVTVEEKPRIPKKEISYSSEVEQTQLKIDNLTDENVNDKRNPPSIKNNIVNTAASEGYSTSPEPEDGNFWDKIGKRETVYLIKRKQNIEDCKEKNKRALFWFPEAEEEALTSQNNIEATDEDKIDGQIENENQLSLWEEPKDLNTTVELSSTCIASKTKDLPINISDDANLTEKKIKITTECVTSQNIKAESTNKISPKSKNKTLKQDTSGVLKCKTTVLLGSNTMGKSASLDKFTEKKVDSDGQIKAKSEKSNRSNHKVDSERFPPIINSDFITTKQISKSKQMAINKSSTPLEPKTVSENNVIRKITTETNKNLKTNNEPVEKPPVVNNSLKTSDITAKVDLDNVNSVADTLGTAFKEGNSLIEKYTHTEVKESVKIGILNRDIDYSNSPSSTISQQSSCEDTSPENVLEKEQIELTKANKTENMFINNENKLLSTNKQSDQINKSIEKEPNFNNDEASTSPSNAEKYENTASEVLDCKTNTIEPTNTEKTIPDNAEVLTCETSSDRLIASSSIPEETFVNVPDTPSKLELQDIPINASELETKSDVQNEAEREEENKADQNNKTDEQPEQSKQDLITPAVVTPKRPAKEEKALRPLIATPRPLQKKAPQVIHSSDSSDTSSEEESSDEDDESDSEESAEFYECENNPDGRTSTGSNDSGFDSSAPTSPATFSQIKKDCDVNCHRKCGKLTANLCGVNQRLLVEALASRTASKKGPENGASTSSATTNSNSTDLLEQELEQSTAYDIFRKTGRFTPPARSIPRFRKYTIEDFQFIKVLGKGSFGKVLLAELRDTEYYYAVKCLKKDVVLEDDDVECTLIERKVLALGTNHPYLCHLFATFQTDSHLFFVMEYLNGGDLMFHIQQSGRFPEARARFYAAEIVSGLKFLHKRGIVYRDLKLDNILLDYEGHVRIADFGMCKLQIYLDKTADTFCGTPDYMAPEIIKGLKYNQAVDWWSFGVLLYEMLIGQSPFSGCDEDELFWSICNEMPSYPRFLSQESLSILTRLLDKDARTRLGGTECMHGDVRDQDFFRAIHWDRLERRELETPFRPRVRHPLDTQYFDRAFTGERPRLTAVEPQVLRSMDQEPFRGFSYTNPNTTDR